MLKKIVLVTALAVSSFASVNWVARAQATSPVLQKSQQPQISVMYPGPPICDPYLGCG
jgi:hypothetical protein